MKRRDADVRQCSGMSHDATADKRANDRDRDPVGIACCAYRTRGFTNLDHLPLGVAKQARLDH